MNERPTPITDKNTYRKDQANCPTKVVPALICRRLERERDEAREQIQIAQNKASRLLVSLAEEKEESGTYYARFRIASDERDEAIKERDEAREELEDWRNAAKGAENPHPDEVHCTCVPLLHKMLKDARETLAHLQEWHGLTDAGLRLRLGELTSQEIRTVRAVLNAVLNQ